MIKVSVLALGKIHASDLDLRSSFSREMIALCQPVTSAISARG
jgi:hypothetical protein